MLVVAIACLAGCAADDDEPPPDDEHVTPSCRYSLAAFYDAGCGYLGADGAPMSEATMVGSCEQLYRDTPAGCDDDIEAWLYCIQYVPAPATSDAECAYCSTLLDAARACG